MLEVAVVEQLNVGELPSCGIGTILVRAGEQRIRAREAGSPLR